jgi:hypothetical protein
MRGHYEEIMAPQDTAVKIKKVIKVYNLGCQLIH